MPKRGRFESAFSAPHVNLEMALGLAQVKTLYLVKESERMEG